MKNSYLSLAINHFKLILPVFILLSLTEVTEAQFANGADIGWLSQMEDLHFVFKDSAGLQKSCMEILKGKGINALRFRVWVNPGGGYCGKKDVATMAHRADSMGFKVMLDFHMSDTWADPANQKKPAAWASHSVTQLDTDIYHHVYDVLDTLKSIGVTPKWVQIGNETSDGMLWEDGRASSHMNNFAAMIQSGYNAVKAIDSSIQVIVHLPDGHSNSLYRWIFDGLKSYGVKWDIIGMSVYPYWANLKWQEDDSLALINMKDMIARYQTKVMVVETGYLFNQPVEANHFLIDLIAKTKSVGGLGVFYWEPESNPQKYPSSGYNLGAWDPVTNKPTAAMDAFSGNYVTSVSDKKNVNNFKLNIYPNPFNPVTNVRYVIPESSLISVVIYDLLGREVARLVNSFKSAGEYNFEWNAGNMPSGVYICSIRAGGYFEAKKIVLLK